MIFDALQQMTNAECCSKDTDVVLLMVFAQGHNKIKKKWVMKTQTSKFINIREIKKFIGIDVAAKLPQIHTVTGGKTTSFLQVVGGN